MHLPIGDVDLVILLLGFGVGFSTKFKTPFMLTLFLIKIVKWWMDTHPTGQKLCETTTIDDEFKKTFAKELKLIEESLTPRNLKQ